MSPVPALNPNQVKKDLSFDVPETVITNNPNFPRLPMDLLQMVVGLLNKAGYRNACISNDVSDVVFDDVAGRRQAARMKASLEITLRIKIE